MAIRLALAVVVAGLVGSDPTELVRRLGAPRYSDREAASTALERLGHDALPALRAARSARDAEVRSRAEELVRRIEDDLLVRPTLVALDFHDRPLGEIVAAIADRGHVGINLVAADPSIASRRVDLERDVPVPFWAAVDDLSRLAGLEMSGGSPVNGFGPRIDLPSAFQMFPLGPGRSHAPSSVSGPFRVTLLNLSYHKERLFGANVANPGMIAFPNAIGRPAAFDGPGTPSQAGIEQFYANFQVLAEPRISIAMGGPPQVTEAADDRGHSLIHPAAHGRPLQHQSGYDRVDMMGLGAVQVSLPLKYPDSPGRSIRRFAGSVPLVVSARKEGPVTIPLAEGKGKSYARSDVILTIHDVQLDPRSGQATVDLAIRPADPEAMNQGMMLGDGIAVRPPGDRHNPLEFADAQGRIHRNWSTSVQSQGPDGLRMTVNVPAGGGVGPAAEVRYYEIARVRAEAPFEFRDVPMP